ncbi:MAG TPA: hypothetical protein VHH73_10955, partial [Verrucomicrobiae bacterium]|nr:hypothetical protein [Verrucomicrobiae bacterium]
YLSGVFRCPLNEGSLLKSGGNGGYDIVRWPDITSYGYNYWGYTSLYNSRLGLGGYFSDPVIGGALVGATAESDVKAPAEMIAVGDDFCRDSQAQYDGGESLVASLGPIAHMNFAHTLAGGGNLPPKGQPNFLAHHGKMNRAFVDGHLEVEDLRTPFAATAEQLRHWNADNVGSHPFPF